MTAHAAAESRRLALPAKAEDVKLELPKDFKLPQGVEFNLDPSKPEFAKLQQLAVARGLDHDTVTDLLGVYAETLVGSESEIQTARAAEISKLGANGPARVTALQTFFTGLIGDGKAKAIESMMATAGIVEALESVVAKFSSQGAASFSQAHREPGGGGKVTEEQYAKMSDADRLNYARANSSKAA